ncbi:MAG: hypothetical protein AAF393_04485 [Pseudomonadota bacterium]
MARQRSVGGKILDFAVEENSISHLVTDRDVLESNGMLVFGKSIFAHCQRIPTDMTELLAELGAFYGLISGWRRILAYTGLRKYTKDARIDSV